MVVFDYNYMQYLWPKVTAWYDVLKPKGLLKCAFIVLYDCDKYTNVQMTWYC